MNTIPCANCRSLIPIQAIKGNTCPKCGSRLDQLPQVSTSQPAPQQVAPQAPQFVPNSPQQIVSQAPQIHSRSSPSLRPRQYPAMTLVYFMYYAIAVVNVLAWVAELVFVFVRVIQIEVADEAKELLIGGAIAFLVIAAIFHLTIAIFAVFNAEVIKIMIDIQDNTQRAAHYISRLASK